MPSDIGVRYARLSMDWNPHHLYPWSARLLGYRAPIAHGLWTLAKTIALITGENVFFFFALSSRSFWGKRSSILMRFLQKLPFFPLNPTYQEASIHLQVQFRRVRYVGHWPMLSKCYGLFLEKWWAMLVEYYCYDCGSLAVCLLERQWKGEYICQRFKFAKGYSFFTHSKVLKANPNAIESNTEIRCWQSSPACQHTGSKFVSSSFCQVSHFPLIVPQLTKHQSLI